MASRLVHIFALLACALPSASAVCIPCKEACDQNEGQIDDFGVCKCYDAAWTDVGEPDKTKFSGTGDCFSAVLDEGMVGITSVVEEPVAEVTVPAVEVPTSETGAADPTGTDPAAAAIAAAAATTMREFQKSLWQSLRDISTSLEGRFPDAQTNCAGGGDCAKAGTKWIKERLANATDPTDGQSCADKMARIPKDDMELDFTGNFTANEEKIRRFAGNFGGCLNKTFEGALSDPSVPEGALPLATINMVKGAFDDARACK
eukprot:g6682.t1